MDRAGRDVDGLIANDPPEAVRILLVRPDRYVALDQLWAGSPRPVADAIAGLVDRTWSPKRGTRSQRTGHQTRTPRLIRADDLETRGFFLRGQRRATVRSRGRDLTGRRSVQPGGVLAEPGLPFAVIQQAGEPTTPRARTNGGVCATTRAEHGMWIRSVIGVALVAVGGIWIAQGTGAMQGSMMSGHGQYAVLGVVTVLIGLALIGWASRSRRRRPR